MLYIKTEEGYKEGVECGGSTQRNGWKESNWLCVSSHREMRRHVSQAQSAVKPLLR